MAPAAARLLGRLAKGMTEAEFVRRVLVLIERLRARGVDDAELADCTAQLVNADLWLGGDE